MRQDTILRRSTTRQTIGWFERYDLPNRRAPFVVPGDPGAGILPRLCVPVRYLDRPLGYVWVLLPAPDVDERDIEVSRVAGEALVPALLAENRSRARQAQTVTDLLSSDPEARAAGLLELASGGALRRAAGIVVVVVVCTGPAWDDAAVRRAFWNAVWEPDPADQVRAALPTESVAVVALERADGDAVTAQARIVRRAWSGCARRPSRTARPSSPVASARSRSTHMTGVRGRGSMDYGRSQHSS